MILKEQLIGTAGVLFHGFDFSSDCPPSSSLSLRTLDTQKSLMHHEMVVVTINMSTPVEGKN